MQASTSHSITPVTHSVDCYYLDTFEDSAWLPDGQSVTYWQAYDPITDRPCGPRGGDVNPEYIRLWMSEKFPAAIEAQIVSVTA
jgi:hypothetical protein